MYGCTCMCWDMFAFDSAYSALKRISLHWNASSEHKHVLPYILLTSINKDIHKPDRKNFFVLHCVLSHKLSSVKIMCLMSFRNGLWCVQTWFYFSFKTHLHLGKYRCFAAAWEYIWSYIMFSTTLRIRRSLCL